MFYWDPKPEIFVIPYLNWPVLWYGVLFMAGFAIGFPIFAAVLRRFFFHDYKYTQSDILLPEKLPAWGKNKSAIVSSLNKEIEKGDRHKIPKRQKNAVLKSHALHPQKSMARLFLDIELKDYVLGIYRKSIQLTDRILIYVLIGTIVGAQLGHFLFYEDPSHYRDIFSLEDGGLKGLSSHGSALGILVAIFLYRLSIKKAAPHLTWIRLLDYICVPVPLCGAFIRIGNFINQEILGSVTSLPWGVIFGHPADHSLPIARHPVQLYEAFFYFLVFIFLWRLSYYPRHLLKEGRIVGLFFILVFGFRFFIEYIKLEQSQLLTSAHILNMGQILSIPLMLVGIYFTCRKSSKALV